MPVDFDDADIAEVVEEVDERAQEALNQQVAEIQEQEEIVEQMSEVEARLELAQYYQLVLHEDLFGGNDSEVAARVQTEIRGFVKSRMQVLVGIGEAPAKPQARIFTDAEVQMLRTLAQPDVGAAIKALAAKVLKKPAILEAKPLPVEKPKPLAPVLKEPILRKITKRPNGPAPSVPTKAPTAQTRPAPTRGKAQVRQVTKRIAENGKEYEQDITPQARPTGSVPQPLAAPRTKEQIQIAHEVSARNQADTALAALEKKLTNR